MTEDEGRLNHELRRAGKAKEVLNNEIFKEACGMIDAALLAGMRNAGIADEKLRLRLLDKYEALHDLLDQLQSTVNTGMLAEKEIEQKTLAQRVKDALRFS